MIHVLLASSVPLACFFGLWLARGRRASLRSLVILPLVCGVSGAWAVAPDTPRLWGDHHLYNALHHRSYCDVWWFHCSIDARNDIDNSMLFPVLFVLAAVGFLVVAWLELRRAEAGRG